VRSTGNRCRKSGGISLWSEGKRRPTTHEVEENGGLLALQEKTLLATTQKRAGSGGVREKEQEERSLVKRVHPKETLQKKKGMHKSSCLVGGRGKGQRGRRHCDNTERPGELRGRGVQSIHVLLGSPRHRQKCGSALGKGEKVALVEVEAGSSGKVLLRGEGYQKVARKGR